MQFDIFTTVSLANLGPEWKDCYLKFSYITAQELKELMAVETDTTDKEKLAFATEKTLAILTDKFVAGKAIAGGKIVEVTKDDLVNFPVSVQKNCLTALIGGDELKKKD